MITEETWARGLDNWKARAQKAQADADRRRELLEKLVLAFDVGDMCHTTLNGRGYSAIAEARKELADENFIRHTNSTPINTKL